MPDPFRLNADVIDLSGRVFTDATVDASPADATETVIATVNVTPDIAVAEGVLLIAYAAFTVGTNGVSANARIRRDSVSGTVVKASGALTVTAAQLHDAAIVGFDTSPTLPNEVYVLTLTVGSATAASTVSAVQLVAVVV